MLRDLNEEINEVIIKSTGGLVDPSSIIIHMKDFTTSRDELSRIIKNKRPTISSNEIISIKREILHGIVERLTRFKRNEVFAVASIVTRDLDIKFRYALKFVLERALMNIENDLLLPIFDTPGHEFSAGEIRDAYFRLVKEGIVYDNDKVPTYPDVRSKLFEEIMISSGGDKIHRGLQIADMIAWILNRTEPSREDPCKIEKRKKDELFDIEKLCRTILNGLFIIRNNKVLTIKIY
ncbi:DUF3800 domain-containing protein [Sulfurisphaera ohwakuensis]|uniref:DUF3800 domain-containing protein n=1 Tax=Sulfurisphaera ohwakuensis TaxID=69656 RepID=UPI0036F42DF3